jgi:hypothetical protein
MTTSPLGVVCPKQLAAHSKRKRPMTSMFNGLIDLIDWFLSLLLIALWRANLMPYAPQRLVSNHLSVVARPLLQSRSLVTRNRIFNKCD